MRRILVSLIIALFCNVCFAQEHLQIMGIPIDGNTDTFKKKLIEKGFVFESCESTSDVVNHEEFCKVKHGTFSGVPIEYIIIFSTPINDIVYAVVVNLAFDSKLDGELFFNRVKETAETKYGRSYRPDRELPYGYSPRTGIRIDHFKGCIQMTDPVGPLWKGDYKHWCVTIHYVDEINHTIAINEQITLKHDLKREWDSDI